MRIIWLLVFLWSSTGIAANAQTTVSLRDKIGQMILIGFDGKKVTSQSPIVKNIIQLNLGGVILFDFDFQKNVFDKNIESPKQVKQLNHHLQQFARLGNLIHKRPNLPLFISIDYEGGTVSRLTERYGFPATQSAAEVGKKNNENAESAAALMAYTLKKAGFNLDFAPVLDTNSRPDNPIAHKSRIFSQDASMVTHYAAIYSRHFLNQKIQCAYKHFPGHGSSTNDSHLGIVDVTKTWKPKELEPYQQLLNLKQTCGMVMVAHVINRQLDKSGKPASLSNRILTDLLRHQLKFKGVIITDDMQMKAISDNYTLKNAVTLAINAGADMLIFGNNLRTKPQDPKQLIDIIEAQVASGKISSERINQAYQHIITMKRGLNTKFG